jgi:hypothetical protein
MAAADSTFVMMVRMTPYRLVLKLYWDSKRSASSDITVRNRKKYLEVILSK